MPKEDDVEKLDEGTLDNLEQVRKGKPRKFVMICKGTSIISLVVYKKGNLEKYKKQAKEVGKGQIYYGLIEGRGPDITFKLSREDGFEKEPVKTMVLRTFLEEQAEYKAKPLFEIVNSHGFFLDPDDPLVQRFTKLQQEALAACDAHPDSANEINAACLAIGKHFNEDQLKEAEEKLNSLQKLLDRLATTPVSGGGNEPQPQTTVDPKQLDELAAQLKRLQPEIDVMLKANVGDVGQLKDSLAAIAAAKTAGNLPSALARCTLIADYLKREWTTQHAQAEQRVDAILAGDFTERAGDVEKIKTVFGFANERAGDGRYGSALVALKNLGTLLTAAEAADAPKESDVIEKGTVEARKKFLDSRWQATIREVGLQVDELRKAIAIAVPDNSQDDLANEIEDYIFEFCDELNEAIFNAKKAGDADPKPVERVLATIKDYRNTIPTEPMFLHLNEARADLGVDIDVQTCLLDALEEIEERLSEPASV